MASTRRYSFADVLAAKEIGARAVSHVSLTRLHDIVTDTAIPSFGIVSAYRPDEERDEALGRSRRMWDAFRSPDLGQVRLGGMAGPHLWVSHVNRALLLHVAEQNGAVMAVYSGAETKGDVVCHWGDGTTNLGKFRPLAIVDAFAEYIGELVSMEATPSGMMEGLVFATLMREPGRVKLMQRAVALGEELSFWEGGRP